MDDVTQTLGALERGESSRAAEAMRRILVENARRKRTLKQGGDLVRQEFDAALLAAPDTHEDLEALDEAQPASGLPGRGMRREQHPAPRDRGAARDA